jgi:hypothetical protein
MAAISQELARELRRRVELLSAPDRVLLPFEWEEIDSVLRQLNEALKLGHVEQATEFGDALRGFQLSTADGSRAISIQTLEQNSATGMPRSVPTSMPRSVRETRNETVDTLVRVGGESVRSKAG